MAKLIVLALAFTALVAFTYAHDQTIITTTIDEDDFDFDFDPSNSKQQSCSKLLKGKQLRQCQNYLQQNQGQNPFQQQEDEQLQQCCQELQSIDEQCQCKAMKQVIKQAQKQLKQQHGRQQIQQLKDKAQNLPNQCKLQFTKQCQIKTIMTVTTIDTGMNFQSCRQQVQRRGFHQCQNYVKQQYQSSRPFWKHGQEQQQEVQQCCQELQNIDRRCQCEAVEEVLRQAQEQQHQWTHQQRHGQRPQQIGELPQIVQNLPNQCNLDEEQCQLSAAMF